MKNGIYIPARILCTCCNHVNDLKSDHCSACGTSFVFGQENRWESAPIKDVKSYQLNQTHQGHECLLENIKPGTIIGTIIGIACSCPKCSATC